MSDASDPRHARNTRCPLSDCKAADCPEHGWTQHAEKPRDKLPSLAKKRTHILLSVRLDDGTFDSSISIPTDADEGAVGKLTESWLKLIESALEVAKKR